VAKADHLLALLDQVARSAGRMVALFGDEFTYRHWPLPGREWTEATGPPPLAHRAGPGDCTRRIVAALNATDARVHYLEDRAIGHAVFCSFLEQLAQAYPTVERLFLILDNWPVHLQPEVLATAERCHIELVFLPTYAPWLNPIEKLWDALKAEVLRHHRLAGSWKEVRREVEGFLDHYADGSPELLYRVGLLGDGLLATALHPITSFQSQ
jgi:transposase